MVAKLILDGLIQTSVVSRIAIVALLGVTLLPVPAAGESSAGASFVRTIDRMMVRLAAQNAAASAQIRETYREYLDLLVLDGYSDLEAALWSGGLAPLPGDPLRFNIMPRTAGDHPIGEKDLVNQHAYIAARPATIGALLEVASRVASGPLEVTSMVRHSEYQDALRSTNPNATTDVPMHTMGLAFDIALVNTPLERIEEIRQVLEEMRDAGDILFIGERRQLVFHVVPQPSRLGYFTDVYARAFAAPAVAARRLPVDVTDAPATVRAAVMADAIDFRPTAEHADAWWDAVDLRPDETVRVRRATPTPVPAPPQPRQPPVWPWLGAGWLALAGVVSGSRRGGRL